MLAVRHSTYVPPIKFEFYDYAPQSRFFFVQWYYNLFHFALCVVAKFIIGQVMFNVFDFFVGILEESIEYCVPRNPKPPSEKQIDGDNERPMNWFFFLPLLIALRLLRFWMSVFSIALGQGEVTAKQMQMKVADFRCYYRSVQYFGAMTYSPVGLLMKESLCSKSVWWQLAYSFYERVFQTTPPKGIAEGTAVNGETTVQKDADE